MNLYRLRTDDIDTHYVVAMSPIAAIDAVEKTGEAPNELRLIARTQGDDEITSHARLLIVPTPAAATFPAQAPQSHGGTGDPPPQQTHSALHASEKFRSQPLQTAELPLVVSEGATVTLQKGSAFPVMQDARIAELERRLRELTEAARRAKP